MKNLFGPTWQSVCIVVALISAIWTVSNIGYYQYAQFLNLGGYNDEPIAFSVYYAVWCLLALAVFHPPISEWAKQEAPGEDRLAPIIMFAGCAVFAFWALPQMPDAAIQTDQAVAEIIVAQPWYFIPKSVEIIFQQILITALVVSLATMRLPSRTIALISALLFGGFHLTLAFNGANPFYVERYTLAATLFGAATPYLIIKMRNGFVYSYALHWSWYAFDTAIWRFVFPAA